MVVLKLKELNINLLPPPKKKGYDIILIIGFIFIFLTLGSYIGFNHYLQFETKIESLEEEIQAQHELKISTIDQMTRLEQEVSEHNFLGFYSKLHSFLNYVYINPYEILVEIENQLPPEASIDYLSFELDGQVQLEGTFKSQGEIATFLEKLLIAEYLIDAQVTNIRLDEENQGNEEIESVEEVNKIKKYIGTLDLMLRTQRLGGDSHD
jgi:hypothetical protein